MARRQRDTRLPAPYLRALRWKDPKAKRPAQYPFTLPWLTDAFELTFDEPVTILMGENGTGKSTLVEAIAALAGYDEAGGGKGYSPVDHSSAIDRNGGDLGKALRAAWLPKVTRGWFFRAETFFPSPGTSTMQPVALARRPIFCPTPMVRGSSASSQNA